MSIPTVIFVPEDNETVVICSTLMATEDTQRPVRVVLATNDFTAHGKTISYYFI